MKNKQKDAIPLSAETVGNLKSFKLCVCDNRALLRTGYMIGFY